MTTRVVATPPLPYSREVVGRDTQLPCNEPNGNPVKFDSIFCEAIRSGKIAIESNYVFDDLRPETEKPSPDGCKAIR